jgi:hypothetical protein
MKLQNYFHHLIIKNAREIIKSVFCLVNIYSLRNLL